MNLKVTLNKNDHDYDIDIFLTINNLKIIDQRITLNKLELKNIKKEKNTDKILSMVCYLVNLDNLTDNEIENIFSALSGNFEKILLEN